MSDTTQWTDKYFVRIDDLGTPILTRLTLGENGIAQIELFHAADEDWFYDYSLSKLDINHPLVGQEISKAEADQYIDSIKAGLY